MKSNIFKRKDEDLIGDIKYFWAKVRFLQKELVDKGYTVTLTNTAALAEK